VHSETIQVENHGHLIDWFLLDWIPGSCGGKNMPDKEFLAGDVKLFNVQDAALSNDSCRIVASDALNEKWLTLPIPL
jgi:hypothetical protein